MKKIILLTLTGILLNLTPVFSWGFKGHKIVAQIAKNCLDKSTIDSVQFYLGNTTFEEASVWMDEIRGDHTFDYMKPMHYVNVEKDKTYVKVSDPNIINELDRVISDLQNRRNYSREKTRQDLLILFHLVGDLHQPLHAGYGEDKGGNTIDVDFLGMKSNLHKVWDTHIIEERKITTDDCLLLINSFTAKEKKAIQVINTVSWMNDSRQLLESTYAFTDKLIDRNYVDKNASIVQKQLAKAGIRLASVLYQAFNKTKPGAVNEKATEANKN